MSKLSEIIYNIKNLQNKGTHTDDVQLSDRQLEFIVNHFRAALAAQRANTNKSVDGFYQELTNIKVVTATEFRAYDSNVKILKSKNPIPSFATIHDNGFLINFVGTRDEFLGFQQSSVHSYNIDLENPYVQNVYFIVGDIMYFATKNYTTMREVFVRGVLNNPRQGYNANTEDKLIGYNWEYPIPEGLISQLNNLIINNEYRWMHTLPSDLINDGKDAE